MRTVFHVGLRISYDFVLLGALTTTLSVKLHSRPMLRILEVRFSSLIASIKKPEFPRVQSWMETI